MSSVLIKGMKMPKECHECRWFFFQGVSCTEPKYYLDARCELVESGQDWYGKDSRGGWVGESIEHIPGWTGYYSYKHCVEDGTRASQCPLCELPSAQQEQHTCVNCGRTMNNGGWYADGETRCPIEEHYALPKDGFCHLWEKRNVTDDDYPERRTDE